MKNADIALLSGVDASQVSRICRGDFRTLSASVVRICKVLDVPIAQDAAPSKPRATRSRRDRALQPEDAAWARLTASVERLWDTTPEGADRLIRVLDAVGNIQTERAARGR